jgi:type II secretory pathway component PulC
MALSFAVFKNGSAASVEMFRSPTWRRLIENPQQWVLTACATLLILLIANEIWTTSRAFFYRPASTAAKVANNDIGRTNVEHIVSAELFGRAAPQSSNQTLPETNLQLTLRGVFTAEDPHRASAMIESSDGHAQIVKTGANVASDTVLQQVFSNHVVLVRNGVPASLYFPTPQASGSDSSVAQNNAVPSTDTPTSNDDNAASASPEELKRAAILRRLEELRARSSH